MEEINGSIVDHRCTVVAVRVLNKLPDFFNEVLGMRSRDSSVGIANLYGLDGRGIEFRWGEIFLTGPDRPCGPPSLLYNGYRVFPWGKAAGGGR